MTPEEMSMRGRIGAHTLHSRVADPVAHTAPARAAFFARFERLVDPDGVLDPQVRAARAEHARKAHMQALAWKSARARKARK